MGKLQGRGERGFAILSFTCFLVRPGRLKLTHVSHMNCPAQQPLRQIDPSAFETRRPHTRSAAFRPPDLLRHSPPKGARRHSVKSAFKPANQVEDDFGDFSEAPRDLRQPWSAGVDLPRYFNNAIALPPIPPQSTLRHLVAHAHTSMIAIF